MLHLFTAKSGAWQIEERKRLHQELMDTLRKQGLDSGTVCNVTQVRALR
jgi:hypothetical protein